jgi:hypothetical protein
MELAIEKGNVRRPEIPSGARHLGSRPGRGRVEDTARQVPLDEVGRFSEADASAGGKKVVSAYFFENARIVDLPDGTRLSRSNGQHNQALGQSGKKGGPTA